MNDGDFVRISHGCYEGCTGVIVAALDGGYHVRMTSTGLVRWFGEDELMREKRTSELLAEEPIAANVPHYRPWVCCPDAIGIGRDGAAPCWTSWRKMQARMADLEARDAARTAADDAAAPDAAAEYARQAARWRGELA
jgi:hypothetical protein